MTKAELADALRMQGRTLMAADINTTIDVYMVMVVRVSGSVFVKELDYFKSQDGMTQTWGESWIPILATSIEDARKRACDLFPYARPYERQAK